MGPWTWVLWSCRFELASQQGLNGVFLSKLGKLFSKAHGVVSVVIGEWGKSIFLTISCPRHVIWKEGRKNGRDIWRKTEETKVAENIPKSPPCYFCRASTRSLGPRLPTEMLIKHSGSYVLSALGTLIVRFQGSELSKLGNLSLKGPFKKHKCPKV